MWELALLGVSAVSGFVGIALGAHITKQTTLNQWLREQKLHHYTDALRVMLRVEVAFRSVPRAPEKIVQDPELRTKVYTAWQEINGLIPGVALLAPQDIEDAMSRYVENMELKVCALNAVTAGDESADWALDLETLGVASPSDIDWQGIWEQGARAFWNVSLDMHPDLRGDDVRSGWWRLWGAHELGSRSTLQSESDRIGQ